MTGMPLMHRRGSYISKTTEKIPLRNKNIHKWGQKGSDVK